MLYSFRTLCLNATCAKPTLLVSRYNSHLDFFLWEYALAISQPKLEKEEKQVYHNLCTFCYADLLLEMVADVACSGRKAAAMRTIRSFQFLYKLQRCVMRHVT